MEFGRFLKDALEEGNVEEVSNLFDHFFKMIINAFGMLEKRGNDLEKRLTSLERGIDTFINLYSVQQSTIKQLKNNLNEVKSLIQKPIKLKPQSQPPKISSKKISTLPKKSVKPNAPLKPTALPVGIKKSVSSVSEEEIAAFRKSILKPTPPQEKIKSKPTSIRAELVQEMKEFFEAVKSVQKKEK